MTDAAPARDGNPAQDRAYRAPAPDGDPSDHALPPSAPQGLHKSFAKARTVREHYRALREKLEYEKQAGTLVLASAVDASCERVFRDIVDTIRRASSELGKTLAGKYDLNSREVVGITTAEIDKAITELRERYKQRILARRKAGYSETED